MSEKHAHMGETLTGLGDPLTNTSPSTGDLGGHHPHRLALVVIWNFEEPHRVGQVLRVPTDGSEILMGRGPAQDNDPAVRARLLWQRPGRLIETPPIMNRRISRQQLLIRRGERGIEVENIGRCKMFCRGHHVSRCELTPGEVMTLHKQMMFLCVERQSAPLHEQLEDNDEAFGEEDLHGLVGESPAMWRLRAQIARLSRVRQHVLVLGESGTGKELVSGAIHASSARASGPFVARNAVTIPDGLFDAELFGNVRDYPNPGMKAREGLVGAADGGTLFLDEIGELPEALQSHLLRLLDGGGEYHRLGEARTRRADIRLVGATNRPTEALKHDLLARFVLRLEVPTLNDRREDIPLLVRHLMSQALHEDPTLHEAHFDDGVAKITPALIEALVTHHYTHHVRELRTLLWSSMMESVDGWLQPPGALRQRRDTDSGVKHLNPDEITREMLLKALEDTGGIKERAWQELGLKNRYVLRRLLKKHGLEQ